MQTFTLLTPPRLRWGWLLVLDFFTASLVGVAFLVLQARWTRRIRGHGKALGLASAYAAGCVGILMAQLFGVTEKSTVLTLVQLVTFILWIATVYTLRYELAEEPIGIPLGWVMPFFFGPVYFQYHVADYDHDSGSGILKLRRAQPTSGQ